MASASSLEATSTPTTLAVAVINLMKQTEAVLPFDRFWRWLQQHQNCILGVGTTDAWLNDYEDLHWHLSDEGRGRLNVQLVRGKQTVGELWLTAGDVVYVEMHPSPDKEEGFEFQAMGGDDGDHFPLYTFVLAHEYDETEATVSATH